MTEHRDEWVSYCSHTNDDGRQDCHCAPDLLEVVQENERLRNGMAAALERTQVDDSEEATAILEGFVHLDGTPVADPTWALVYLRPDGWWEAGRGWLTMHDAVKDGKTHDWKGTDWGVIKIPASNPKIKATQDLVFGAVFRT